MDSVTDLESQSLYWTRGDLMGSTIDGDSYSLLSTRETATCSEPEPTECMVYAARLVKDAIQMRQIAFKRNLPTVKSYEFYLSRKVSLLMQVVILVHLLLPIFEKPAVIETPYWVPCLVEFFCLLVFFIRWLHLWRIETAESFFKEKKNWVLFWTFLIIYCDLILYIAAHKLEFNFKTRLTRPLRVLIFINLNEGKILRRVFRNLRKTLPDIMNVFALFLVSILLFGFMAFKLFSGKRDHAGNLLVYPNGEPYFKNYIDTIWDLYVMVTTVNFPDIMMPAYNLNSFYSIFFVAYMLINVYIFINVILATIYTNYRKHLKEEVRRNLANKRLRLKDSFDLLKEKVSEVNSKLKGNQSGESHFKLTHYIRAQDEEVLTAPVFRELMKHIDAAKSDSQIDVLFKILDFDDNKVLSFNEFVHLADLLTIRMSELRDRQVIFDKWIPVLYNSRASKIIRRIVRYRFFELFFDLLIFLNVFFLVFFSEEFNIEWVFLIAFMVELALKIYAYGFKKFISSNWNIFDSFIITASVVAYVLFEFKVSRNIDANTTQYFEIIVMLRSLRIFRFITSIKRFRTIITTIAVITPSLLTYSMLLMTIFYVFSMIGMEIFGKAVKTQSEVGAATSVYNCHNPRLNNTEFAHSKYCKNNFSTFPNSIILLFELMVANQWHVLSKGFEYAMGTKWTRLYFFAFHLSCVIVSLNIFTAFIIEAFLLEYETEGKNRSQSFSKIEKRIIDHGLHYMDDEDDDDDSLDEEKRNWFDIKRIKEFVVKVFIKKPTVNCYKGRKSLSSTIRLHINAKEAKPVEILLQRMFSDEFDIENEDLECKNPPMPSSTRPALPKGIIM